MEGENTRAAELRQMTDDQLCAYVDGLAASAFEDRFRSFLFRITCRTEDGIRISDATVRKLEDLARRYGYLREEPGRRNG